jgi:hypothetical protein
MGLKCRTFLLCAVLCAAACDDSTLSTATTPTTITTQTFTGTLSVNGGKTEQFATTGRGPVNATLTSVNPDTAIIGVSIGVWNGISCQLVQINDQAMQGAVVSATVSGVGNLCLRVYDPGKLTGPVDYSVDVSHP